MVPIGYNAICIVSFENYCFRIWRYLYGQKWLKAFDTYTQIVISD